MRRADHLTEAHQAHLDRLHTAWDALQELYQLYESEGLDQANQAPGRFADLYATGQIPEYREVVDTIIAWGEEILAYHYVLNRTGFAGVEFPPCAGHLVYAVV